MNLLSATDTFGLADYNRRFSLEMDKANLFRMLGHTDTGLEILQNLSDCDLDSAERAALNQIMFIYEEETVKQGLGYTGYRSDTTYIDASQYATPTATQASEFYFGSVINSLSSVTYRSCSANKQQVKEDDMRAQLTFAIFPNPTDGLINLSYTIPEEGNARVEVYGMNGQIIYGTMLPNGKGQLVIDLSFVQSGMYFYNVFIDEAIEHSGRIAVTN